MTSFSDSTGRRLAYRRSRSTDESRRLERAVCARDIVHWINHWCWTFDPRGLRATVPFDLFPKQIDFLRWLADRERNRENGLAEKSRDWGLTFLCCCHALHGWLYRDGYTVGFGSRKLELVDKRGDPKSIFEKIRLMLYNLPEWMLPVGFKRESHDNVGRLLNPANGATITAEGGDDIGRGGRTTIYFVDEAAFLEHPDMIERSLLGNTDCRIDVSTPNGPGNPFARKRFSGTVPVFTGHYRDDPRKTPEWVVKKKATTDPVAWAQEYEIDYTASIEGICIPAAWVRAAVGLDLPESGELICGLDIAEEGPNKTVLIPRRGPVVKIPAVWDRCNTTETAWRARDEMAKNGGKKLIYDSVGVGAGVRGTLNTSEKPLTFRADPVNTGTAPQKFNHWPDGQSSAEKFLNLRAEVWWLMRTRFEKTYEYVTQSVAHPPEDMISIPDCPELIAQLSQILVERTETGKIKMESKDKMRRRGVKSPDHADALALTFAPGKLEVWVRL